MPGHLGFWLHVCEHHVTTAFAKRLETHGITVGEFVIMRVLYDRPPMPPTRIADQIEMSRGVVTKTADRLEAKGLIERRRNPGDKRGQFISLTAAGEALVPRLVEEADAIEQRAFGALGAEGRETFERLLKTVIGHFARDRTTAEP